MRTGARAWKAGALIGCVALVVLSTGCASTYFRDRGRDFLDIGEFGITTSEKPGFALYVDGISLLPIGFAYIDGWFSGWGGVNVGTTRFYTQDWGAVVFGYEENGWGDEFKIDDPTTLNRQFVGLGGIPFFPTMYSRPSYYPACIHHFHLGWIGVAFNLRYLEIVDFLLGWTTLDISNDDTDQHRARWGWRSEDDYKADNPTAGRLILGD